MSAGSALANHLVDGIRRARVANLPAVITARRPVMVLHQAGVPNAIVCRGDAHAPARLLHHDGQDEAVVDAAGPPRPFGCRPRWRPATKSTSCTP